MNNIFTHEFIIHLASFGLLIIGFYIIFTQKNLIKIILGLNIADTGINIFLVSTGYFKNHTAPIFSKAGLTANQMTDPIPQALVLTAIVIGFGITALALSLVIKLYKKTGTLDVSNIRGLKW